jgi:hypothetical protein
MLGPIDIEDWSDEASELRVRLRARPEFMEMKTNPGLTRLKNLTDEDFKLLARFCAEENLSDGEIDALIEALHA